MSKETWHIEAVNVRKFSPLPDTHPSIGERCPACREPFKAGDTPTLIPIGPGTDAEERERCREGRAFTAVAIMAHWSCVTGHEP